ncbi:extracellular solute-binding protein [Paenibacillus ginsengarvi]|uniref:Extracellular solute-binding protein n=1 Tax=Paenibacillus ginsengarvi TaxID=400777 RepID=A0A3B0CHG9_9BACL|nr:extracellular solute-binding protein [Paenibacillus ginsengarvi]RKN83757.1 extracellular solute-binding protein [Paenibacillus ginsengarvi]
MSATSKRSGSRTRLEQLIQTLRDEIVSGARAEGAYIPSELTLCEQFGLSKKTVRKGLDVLVNEGLLEKVPRIGARVTGAASSEPIVITFGYYPKLVREIRLQHMIESFNKLHGSIRVQAIPISHHYDQTLNTRRLQDDSLDVVTINAHDIEYFTQADDGTCPLEPLAPVGGIYPFLEQPFRADGGGLYALPFVFTPVILCYNKEHFHEKELPEPDSSWTWEDLRQAGHALSNGANRFGFYFHLPSGNRWPIFLLQNNVAFRTDGQGGYILNVPEAKEALRLCRDLVRDPKLFPVYLSENDSDAHALFLNRKVSMILCTYDSLNDFSSAPFVYDIAPIPSLREPKTLLGAIALAIPAHSAKKPEAKLFIDYMLSYQNQMDIRLNTLSIPSLKRAAEWVGDGEADRVLNRPYRFHMYRDIIPSFRFASELRLPTDHLLQMGQELKLYWSQLEDLDTILDQLEQKLSAPASKSQA